MKCICFSYGVQRLTQFLNTAGIQYRWVAVLMKSDFWEIISVFLGCSGQGSHTIDNQKPINMVHEKNDDCSIPGYQSFECNIYTVKYFLKEHMSLSLWVFFNSSFVNPVCQSSWKSSERILQVLKSERMIN